MNGKFTSPMGRKLVGGELCLDFANTVDWHASDHPEDGLRSYEDLISWCRRVDVLDDSRAARLLREALGRPLAARTVLQRAVTIREAIYRIIVAGLEGRKPGTSDLLVFNGALNSALQHLRIVPAERGLEWSWGEADCTLNGILWPILLSAAGLLSSEMQYRIGQCADDRGCGWLFLDKTKNHSRRWCDMKDCGNRAKAQRHYKRTHLKGKGRLTRSGEARSGRKG